MNITKKKKITIKNKLGSLKLGSQVIWIFFWFSFIQDSHISREPVKLSSNITQPPKIVHDQMVNLMSE